MAYLVEFETSTGTTVVEVEGDPPLAGAGPIKAGISGPQGRVMYKAQVSFEDALRAVAPTIATFSRLVDGLSPRPAEMELTLGLKVAGELGIMAIAKASGEANYTLKLTWRASGG